MKNLLLSFAQLAWLPVVYGQQVYRCVGENGQVTFSQQGCGTEPQPDQAYDATNVPPSGGDEVVPWGDVNPMFPPRQGGFSVSGKREVRPCQEYVGKHPYGGSSQSGIRSQFGRPDRESSYNGRDSWTWYQTSREPYRSVDFDEAGCARSYYESQTPRR